MDTHREVNQEMFMFSPLKGLKTLQKPITALDWKVFSVGVDNKLNPLL